jgi:Fur family zinc uptake transcriptional regulator
MDPHCGHSPARHLEPKAVSRALAQAEAGCKARGERWTASRQRVLELLLTAGGPVKAYDLMASFDRSGAPAKPPTVYRALEFLEQQSLVHRIAGINAFIACDADQAVHTAAFLICDCCGSAEEFDPSGAAITAIAAQNGFKVDGVTLEVRGRCRWCAENGQEDRAA